MAYSSGEPIIGGDRIRYGGRAGYVEFLTRPDDPATAWYLANIGDGCMVVVDGMGSVFLPANMEHEDLELVSREGV